MAMEAGKELQRIVLALCIQSELRKLPWALTDWNTVDVYNACTYTSRRNLLLDFSFLFCYQHQKREFCPLLEAWTPVLVSILEYDSEEVLFLSLAPLPNVLQPCPIKIYSSHMFLVVTLCSATVGLFCGPRLSRRRSKPGNCCAWEDQPAEPRWTVNQTLKAQPF